MKLRPGIFDPWRQEQETPPAPQKQPATEDEGLSLELVRYDGLRAGIHVRVAPSADLSLAARTALVGAVHRLARDERVKKALDSWGITLGVTKSDTSVVLSADNKSVSISLPTTAHLTQRAIDTLALFFREVSASADLHDTLTALGITPYLK